MTTQTFTPPPMNRFDAASGLLLMLFMAAGYLFGMQGMPDLGDGATIIAWYKARGSLDCALACVMVTIAFFFTFWFMGLIAAWMRAAEGPNGHLTWVSYFGGVAFTTVFAGALAFVLAPGLLINMGISDDAIYLMHAASLLTGVTTATTGPAFFIPIAIVAFRTGMLPRWLCWFTVLAAFGSVTPIFGAFALTGPFNVGNGWVGIHAVAASWVGWSGVTSAWMLTQLKRNGA
jgi:hypothetical protein